VLVAPGKSIEVKLLSLSKNTWKAPSVPLYLPKIFC